jgi:hypothetical protein
MLVAHLHHENFHYEHFSMLDTTAADHYVEHAVCSPGCPWRFNHSRYQNGFALDGGKIHTAVQFLAGTDDGCLYALTGHHNRWRVSGCGCSYPGWRSCPFRRNSWRDGNTAAGLYGPNNFQGNVCLPISSKLRATPLVTPQVCIFWLWFLVFVPISWPPFLHFPPCLRPVVLPRIPSTEHHSKSCMVRVRMGPCKGSTKLMIMWSVWL